MRCVFTLEKSTVDLDLMLDFDLGIGSYNISDSREIGRLSTLPSLPWLD